MVSINAPNRYCGALTHALNERVVKPNLILKVIAFYAAFTAAFTSLALPGVYFTVRSDEVPKELKGSNYLFRNFSLRVAAGPHIPLSDTVPSGLGDKVYSVELVQGPSRRYTYAKVEQPEGLFPLQTLAPSSGAELLLMSSQVSIYLGCDVTPKTGRTERNIVHAQTYTLESIGRFTDEDEIIIDVVVHKIEKKRGRAPTLGVSLALFKNGRLLKNKSTKSLEPIAALCSFAKTLKTINPSLDPSLCDN